MGRDHKIHSSPTGRPIVSIGLYEALLYWKLYSQPAAVAELRRWLDPEARPAEADSLARLIDDLPNDLQRDEAHVISLVRHLGAYELVGMKTEAALPVRTTFLHFIFPDVVPIFDKMVLQAVGVHERGANRRMDVFREYLPFAWKFADEYGTRCPQQFGETPIRLIDMALWVVRGRSAHHLGGPSRSADGGSRRESEQLP